MRPELCLLGKAGVQVYGAPVRENGKYTSLPEEITQRYEPALSEHVPASGAKSLQYSSGNGNILAVLTANAVKILSAETGELVRSIAEPKVQAVSVSPLGSYIVTWSRYAKEEAKGNLVVWRVSDGNEVLRLFQKSYTADKWPAVKFTPEEEIAGHMVKNNVHLYRGTAFEDGIVHKVKCEGVSNFAVASTPGPECVEFPFRIATFKADMKGRPAQVSIYNFPGGALPIRSKSFFRAEGAELKWSPLGNTVLAKTETTVDATGESYYGESGVYLLRADVDFDCNLITSKEGHFQDIAWSPKGREFIAISGKMPALAAVYNLKGEAVFEFGCAHRNTICWSPHGRFVCLGGFGNLAGDMDFWDMNKKKKMGSTKANCAVDYGWSPCGRYFLTATLFPRMRVENGFTIYSYAGDKVFAKTDFPELYRALWRPASMDVYPDRPQSPGRKNESIKAAADPPKVSKPYRPPGASSRLADMMRAEREGSSAPKKIQQTTPVISKAKARRERKKLAAAKAGQNAKPKAEEPKETTAEVQAVSSKYDGKTKALRKLNKQLKAIRELEAKKAGGATLNESQLQKLEKKAHIEREIAELS